MSAPSSDSDAAEISPQKKLDSPADVVLPNPPLFPDENSVSDNPIPELSEGENSLLTVFSFFCKFYNMQSPLWVSLSEA